MSDASHKLNPQQRELVLAWLGEGFSDQEIKDKIDAERGVGEVYDGEHWPSITRQGIRYWRERWGDRFAELQANNFDIALGTGLAKRQVAVRRAARRAGSIDHLIDLFEAEAKRLVAEGVLRGEPYLAAGDPDVLEAEWTVDGGARQGKLPALSRVRLGDPVADPRYCRLMEIMAALAKHYQAHERYLQLIVKLGGLGSKQGEADEASTPQERRKTAEDLFSQLREEVLRDQAKKAGVPV